MKSFLYLMQMTDSNLPTGAFSHSFGLETLIHEGKITNSAQFKPFLINYISQLLYTDGLTVRIVYDALEQNDFSPIIEADIRLFCSATAKETRLGVQRIGQQMTKLFCTLYDNENLERYAKLIQQKKCYGHPAICQAIALYDMKLDKKSAIETVLYTSVSSLVQNAVRGIPLGQTDGQQMQLVAIQTCIETAAIGLDLPMAYFCASSSFLEIQQMKHESIPVRLFMS